jgi:four helix bundle protein
VQDFRQLVVWQKGHALTLDIYRITRDFPGHELYGLTSQIRRAAASIPTNVAEGCVKSSDRDFARSAEIALGSASEVEYLLMLALDLSLIDQKTCDSLSTQATEIKRMLAALLKRLRSVTDRARGP